MQEEIVPAVRGPQLPLPNFVPELLARADKPVASLLVAWALAWGGSLLLAALWQGVLPAVEGPDFEAMGWFGVFMLAVFAPVVETFIMAAILWVLTRFVKPTAAIVASALIWGAAHSALAPAWGLVIWWPFLIFSTLYLVWRQRSILWALAMPMLAHAMQNLPSAILVNFPDLITLPAA
ncbi:CPBP family intramembrane glutamic endopeptidase [Sphingomicrobium clamense]|uniref:CPBP family intramembrane metalloprotease n=1 Tax=Sphingomicrobium clamense TaxID=2851013 RepID=A0ABS6V6N9_9SPHN|nr:CPBP family intramembrane metalloprotease [Sphingomicrobium sp. B8]